MYSPFRRFPVCDFAAYCGKIERNMLHKGGWS